MPQILDKQAFTQPEIDKMLKIAQRMLEQRFFSRQHSAHVRAIYQEVTRNYDRYSELLNRVQREQEPFDIRLELRNTR